MEGEACVQLGALLFDKVPQGTSRSRQQRQHYQEAMEPLEFAVRVCQEVRLVVAKMKLGCCYLELEEYEKSVKLHTESVAEAKGKPQELSCALINLGNSYAMMSRQPQHMHRSKDAARAYEEAIKASEQEGNKVISLFHMHFILHIIYTFNSQQHVRHISG